MNFSEAGLRIFRCMSICNRPLAMLLQQNSGCLHHGDLALLSKKMAYSEVGQSSDFCLFTFFWTSQMIQDTQVWSELKQSIQDEETTLFKTTAPFKPPGFAATLFFSLSKHKHSCYKGKLANSEITPRSRGSLLLLAERTSEPKGGGIKRNSLLFALSRHRQLSTGSLRAAIKVCHKRPPPP